MKKILVLAITMFFITTAALAGTATLNWTAPTTWSDGSPLITITGYNVYYGNTHLGPYPNKQVVTGNVTTAIVNGLTNGTWYFVTTTTATNNAGAVVESGYSMEVSKIIDERLPNPPTNLTVVTVSQS